MTDSDERPVPPQWQPDPVTRQTAVVPVPYVPKGWVLVPIQWLAGAVGVVMGAGILSVQLYVQIATSKAPDRDLILAGVGLLTAGTVAEIRSHRKG